MKRRARPGEARAWLDAFVDNPPATDACIEWPFALAPNGYPRIVHPSYETHLVHRIVLTACGGEPPAATSMAAHKPTTCHNPGCVNPRHLRWASNTENQQDRVRDNTSNRGRGSQLTKQHVLTIARSRSRSVALGDQFGISRQAVADIRSGRTWAWLTGINQQPKEASAS